MQQNYRCVICERAEASLTRKLHLDHDHTTGVFRGWLCRDCNLLIAKNDASLLRKAARYVART